MPQLRAYLALPEMHPKRHTHTCKAAMQAAMRCQCQDRSEVGKPRAGPTIMVVPCQPLLNMSKGKLTMLLFL